MRLNGCLRKLRGVKGVREMGESVVEDVAPKLSFKNVGFIQLASTGRSLVIQIMDCHRSVFECRRVYVSCEHLHEIIHGNRKDACLYVLEPTVPET